MGKMNKYKAGDLTEEEELYRDCIKKPRNFDKMKRGKSSNCNVPPTKKVLIRADKPGRRCVAWSTDTSWLVFVDTKYHNKYYYVSQCFIWNRHTHAKLDLPNLDHPDDGSFLKCVFYCSEIHKGTWEFKIVFCLKNESSYIWSSPDHQDWQRQVHFSWLPFDVTDHFHFSDAVALDYTCKNGQRKELCYITHGGMLVTETTTQTTTRSTFKLLPNPDIITYERKLVNYCETTLFLLQRKAQSAWEVWKMDLSQEIWESFSSSNSEEGLVFFTSRGYSAAYPRSEKLRQNCVCYTEEGDRDNLYVFWLADQSLSVFKNQPNSGFPYWFPETTHSRIPWLSFLEDKNVIIIADDAYQTTPRCLDESYCRDNICCELIPGDIWSSIAESLTNVADYASFRGVCKMWRDVARPICWKPDDIHHFLSSNMPVQLLPWLMTRSDINQEKNDSWSFIDPTCNMQYYINLNELSGCEIQYSKDGWLLVTRDMRTMFFLEPFSKTKINLVDIPELFSSNDGMSFSSSPTSLDWIIFVQRHQERDLIFSAYLRSGDEDWNILEYDITETKHNYICSSSSPLFHNHKFYTLGRDGSLFIIDSHEDTFEFKFPNVDNIGSNEPIFSGSGYLVSCENELYRVVIGSLGRFITIYKLIDDDEPESHYINWDEVKSFNDYAFFVSEKSSFATPVTQNAHQNSINFPVLAENRCLSHKLEVSEFKSFDGDSIDRGIYGRKELFGGTWIQPKVVRAFR